MAFRDTAGKKLQKEPEYIVKDPKALAINNDLERLKRECARKGLDQEDTLNALTAFAESRLAEDPSLGAAHRFSCMSGLIETRLLIREQVTR